MLLSIYSRYVEPNSMGVYVSLLLSIYSRYVEPNSIGVYVSQFATSDSVTFQAINLGFGDTDLVSVKVNYQACNIGPDPYFNSDPQ